MRFFASVFTRRRYAKSSGSTQTAVSVPRFERYSYYGQARFRAVLNSSHDLYDDTAHVELDQEAARATVRAIVETNFFALEDIFSVVELAEATTRAAKKLEASTPPVAHAAKPANPFLLAISRAKTAA